MSAHISQIKRTPGHYKRIFSHITMYRDWEKALKYPNIPLPVLSTKDDLPFLCSSSSPQVSSSDMPFICGPYRTTFSFLYPSAFQQKSETSFQLQLSERCSCIFLFHFSLFRLKESYLKI